MSVSIGRWGDDLTVQDPMTWQQDGDRVRLSGICNQSTDAAYQAAREQFHGLISSKWEPIVPCIFGHDSTKDGYYRILGGGLDLEAGITYPDDAFRWDLELERLPNYQYPKILVTSIGVERSTKDASVADNPWSAVPSDATGSYTVNSSTVAHTTRTGPGHSDSAWAGTAVHWRTSSYYLGATSGGVAEYRVAASDYYDMSCRLTVDGYTVLGDRWNFQNNLSDWVVSNGFVKLTGSGSSFCTITGPDPASPTAWGAVDQAMDIGFLDGSFQKLYPGSSAIDVVGLRVDYNGPERITVTFFGEYVASGSGIAVPASFTMVLRRGSSYAEFYASSTSYTRNFMVGFNSTTATTSITGASHATSNDADGSRVFMCMEAETLDTTNGTARLTTAAKQGQFAIGVELNGSSSSGINTVANCRDQYYAAVS